MDTQLIMTSIVYINIHILSAKQNTIFYRTRLHYVVCIVYVKVK